MQAGDRQVKDTGTSFFPFPEPWERACLPALPFTADCQSAFENLSYEDGCLKVKVSTLLAGLPTLCLQPAGPPGEPQKPLLLAPNVPVAGAITTQL